MDAAALRESVARVIEDVGRRGDEALAEYTRKWDGVELRPEAFRVPPEKLSEAPGDSPFAAAFHRAAGRIERFHRHVRPRSTMYEDEEGAVLGLRWTPVRAVGLYVPGGKAAYPSTLAMTAVPARIAGVERIVVVSPPGPDGEVNPQVLLAARVLGLREVYRLGGAQAIAALAHGTETVPRVDKIFGPGNAFVAEAKQQLYGRVGIDLVAGPSEIVVWVDETCEPDWVAADLMAQAEHDEDTRVTLLASSASLLETVKSAYETLVRDEPRREVIEAAVGRNGRFEVVSGPEEAARRIDEIAPEHLSIQVADPWRVLPRIRNAGAIFLGKESPVAVGDYYAGTNHVLPTGTTARFASCLSVEDFMKRSNVASLPAGFVDRWGADVEELARGESLDAHATSVRLRRTGWRRLRARPGVRAVTPYLLVEEEAEVKLNQNESPFDVPREVKDAVARRLSELPWNRYAQRLPAELAEAIAREAPVPADGVLVASGSNLILQWIFEAYGGPGATALAPDPSFSLYPLWAEVTETRLVTCPLAADLSYDADALLRRVRETRPGIVVLCLPNNPTGSEMEPWDVRRVAEAAAEHGGLVVVDEAYREFSDPRFDRTALVRELPNLLLLRTCSKAFSSAGMRLGYLLAPPDVASELRKVVPPFHLSLFQAVLGLELWARRASFAERVEELVASRERMMEELRSLSAVEVVPSQANFFLFRVSDPDAVFEGLAERGVLIRRPGGGDALRGCLRVNLGTEDENRRFVEALRGLVGAD